MIEYDARGNEIEVLAPGGGYTIQTGTSFAAPHITSLVALMLQIYPKLTAPEAKSLLTAMSTKKEK